MADSTAAPRPSRYKSQRRQHPSADEDLNNAPPLPNTVEDDGVARSKSRYRRKAANPSTSPTEPMRPVTRDRDYADGDVPVRYHASKRLSPSQRLHRDQEMLALVGPHSADFASCSGNSPPAQIGALDARARPGNAKEHSIANGGHQDLQPKPSVKHKPDAAPVSSTARPPMPPPVLSRELYPPAKLEAKPACVDGPPTSGQIRATKSMSEMPIYDNEHAGCFGFFKRKRGEAARPAIDKTQIGRPMMAQVEQMAIRKGGGGVVPGTDAPVSAVNAGDRQVLVECGRSRTIFPVTPTTTSTEIIKSAAICMSERINVKSAVLLESFDTVGVQRPLRRYERVRDVMNSWDTDKQNALLLVDPGTGSSEAELSLAGAPQVRPVEQSWLLSYSQKVGKWDKRLITIRQDGQVVCQKDYDRPKDIVNICHLSDFDIYTPTPEQSKKKIKPPKKYCYAVKSQQKTSMFESTQNFVHFFSTADRVTADEFYQAVQGWRSWYLVNVMGEGKKADPVHAPDEQSNRPTTSRGENQTHKVKDSVASQYELGSFKPFFNTDQYEQRPTTSGSQTASGGFTKSANQFDVNVSPERRTVRKPNIPVALNKQPQLAEDEPLANLARHKSVEQKRISFDQAQHETDAFKSTGLLGRSQSQKQKDIAANAFTAGPSLLNGGYGSDEANSGPENLSRRQKSTRKPAANSAEMRRNRSTREGRDAGLARSGSIDLRRSGSRAKEPSKPLIDLTPQYREPPQHSKKGKGYHPDAVGPGGLVDLATSPENLIGIPPSSDWRARSAHNSPALADQTSDAARGRGNARLPSDHSDPPGRSKSCHHDAGGSKPISRVKSVKKPAHSQSPDGFTGEGLLAAVQPGWGGESRGRGVMDGRHAGGKPMVDLSEKSTFAQGSLLNRIEWEQAANGPVVER